jgi:hypothetical protein
VAGFPAGSRRASVRGSYCIWNLLLKRSFNARGVIVMKRSVCILRYFMLFLFMSVFSMGQVYGEGGEHIKEKAVLILSGQEAKIIYSPLTSYFVKGYDFVRIIERPAGYLIFSSPDFLMSIARYKEPSVAISKKMIEDLGAFLIKQALEHPESIAINIASESFKEGKRAYDENIRLYRKYKDAPESISLEESKRFLINYYAQGQMTVAKNLYNNIRSHKGLSHEKINLHEVNTLSSKISLVIGDENLSNASAIIKLWGIVNESGIGISQYPPYTTYIEETKRIWESYDKFMKSGLSCDNGGLTRLPTLEELVVKTYKGEVRDKILKLNSGKEDRVLLIQHEPEKFIYLIQKPKNDLMPRVSNPVFDIYMFEKKDDCFVPDFIFANYDKFGGEFGKPGIFRSLQVSYQLFAIKYIHGYQIRDSYGSFTELFVLKNSGELTKIFSEKTESNISDIKYDLDIVDSRDSGYPPIILKSTKNPVKKFVFDNERFEYVVHTEKIKEEDNKKIDVEKDRDNLKKNGCAGSEKFCHYHRDVLWSDISSVSMGWFEAEEYCKNMGGGLPSINNLRSIIENCPVTETGGSCSAVDSCQGYGDCLNSFCSQGCANSSEGIYSKFGDTETLWSNQAMSEEASLIVIYENGKITNDHHFHKNKVRCVKIK